MAILTLAASDNWLARDVAASDKPHGEIVNIVTWFLLVVAALTIMTRLAVKWNVSRSLGADDAIVLAALTSNIACGISISVAIANGFGLPIASVNRTNADIQFKSVFTSFFLYISTTHLAKISILLFIRDLTPVNVHRRCAVILGTLIACLWVAQWLTIAFQCSFPDVWSPLHDKCIDRVSFWRFTGAASIATDVALVVLPFFIVNRIQLGTFKKCMAMISFASRILDVVATAVQLAYSSNFASPDLSADLWQWVLLSQLMQCISIITSCLPYFKPLLVNMPSGMYIPNEVCRRGLSNVEQDLPARAGKKVIRSYILRDVDAAPDIVQAEDGDVRPNQVDMQGLDHRTTPSGPGIDTQTSDGSGR